MTNAPLDTGKPGRAVTVRDVVAVLFRRRWILIGIFAVTTVVTAALTLTQPVHWESTGKVLLRRGFQDNLMHSYQRTLTWEEELASEEETAKSPTVVRRAGQVLDGRRKALGLEPYAIDVTRVEAAVIGESNVLAISYQDLVPEVCTEVTDALLVAYAEFREETYQLPFPEDFFEDEIARTKAELDSLQDERQEFLSQSNIVDLGMERNNMLTSRSAASQIASQHRRDMSEMQIQLSQMHDYLLHPENYPDIPFTTHHMVGDENVISSLKRDLVLKKARLAELNAIYRPQVQEVVRLRGEIEGLEALLVEEVRDHIRLTEMRLASHSAKLAEAEREVERITTRLDAMPLQESYITDLDRRLATLTEKYTDVARDRTRALTTQATGSKQTVYILSPASAPYPKNTKDYVRMALAPIFSLIVGLGLAFFVDSLDTTVKNPRDAEAAFDVPVLATLSEQKNRKA